MSLWRDEGTALRKSSRYFDKFSVSLPKDTVFTLTAKRVSFPSVENFFHSGMHKKSRPFVFKATFKDNIDIHCELLPRLPNTTNFSISDVSSIDLLGHCSTVFEASSGAACHAGRSAG